MIGGIIRARESNTPPTPSIERIVQVCEEHQRAGSTCSIMTYVWSAATFIQGRGNKREKRDAVSRRSPLSLLPDLNRAQAVCSISNCSF